MAQRFAAWFWFVAARRGWWWWLSALVLESCAWWFAARGRRRARMCLPEVRDLRFVFAAGDSLMSRCSEKMERPFRVGMKRLCERRQSKNRHRRSETARRCRPTSRRRGHSQLGSQTDNVWAEDQRKPRFYLENDSATGRRPRAVTHGTMRWKCK